MEFITDINKILNCNIDIILLRFKIYEIIKLLIKMKKFQRSYIVQNKKDIETQIFEHKFYIEINCSPKTYMKYVNLKEHVCEIENYILNYVEKKTNKETKDSILTIVNYETPQKISYNNSYFKKPKINLFKNKTYSTFSIYENNFF